MTNNQENSQIYRLHRLETRIKEHKDTSRKGTIGKFTIVEHTWTDQHPILWDEITVIDQTRRETEHLLIEALHIHLTYEKKSFNWDRSSWLLDLHSSCS